MSYFVMDFNDFTPLLAEWSTAFRKLKMPLLNMLSLKTISSRYQLFHFSLEEKVMMNHLGINEDDVYTTFFDGELRFAVMKRMKEPIVELDFSIAQPDFLENKRYCKTYSTIFISYDLLLDSDNDKFDAYIYTLVDIIARYYLTNKLINEFGDIDFNWVDVNISVFDDKKEFSYKSIQFPTTIAGITSQVNFNIAKWVCVNQILKLDKNSVPIIESNDDLTEYIKNCDFEDLVKSSNEKLDLISCLYEKQTLFEYLKNKEDKENAKH